MGTAFSEGRSTEKRAKGIESHVGCFHTVSRFSGGVRLCSGISVRSFAGALPRFFRCMRTRDIRFSILFFGDCLRVRGDFLFDRILVRSRFHLVDSCIFCEMLDETRRLHFFSFQENGLVASLLR